MCTHFKQKKKIQDMRLLNIKTIVLAVLMISAVAMNAQKFGYVNSAQLLSELPAVKAAESELETFQKQLMSSGEAMVKKLEAKIQAYSKEAQEGLLSQVQMQKKEEELGAEQQKIQAFEVEVQNKILQKRETLYAPILDQVKKAIEAVGADGSYTMIFDNSGGTILHANASEDVMSLVKTKLGL